jgi:hypothetical protein
MICFNLKMGKKSQNTEGYRGFFYVTHYFISAPKTYPSSPHRPLLFEGYKNLHAAFHH